MLNKIGSEYIKGQITKIKSFRKGIEENKDIEYLHKVRVSSRKILAAVYLFENYFKKNSFREWERELKTLAKKLGKPRDLDVHIQFLDNFIQTHQKDAVKTGVNRIKVRFTQKRIKYQDTILVAIDEFLSWVKDNPLNKSYILEKEEGENLKQKITSLIENKLSRIKMFEAYIYNINNVEELHELRKANKLLRYALEIFNPHYENKLLPYINEITKTQDKLGLIHDCDVWGELLPDFIEKEKKKTIRFYGEVTPFYNIEPGIRYLGESLQKSREEQYYLFLEEWKTLNTNNFMPDLINLLLTGNEGNNSPGQQNPAIVEDELPQNRKNSFLTA